MESESRSVVSDSLRPQGLYSPWSSPGQNTGVGSGSLLQGIFLTQESNQGLLHCRQILYQLSYERRSPGAAEANPVISHLFHALSGFPDSSVGKEPTCNAGDPGSIPGSGRSPEEGKG